MTTLFSEKLKVNRKTANVILKVKNQLWTWLEGSAQSGKSVAAALAFAALIEDASEDDYIYLAIGYTSTSAKNNSAFVGGFGLEHYFGSNCRKGKYFGTDALYIKTKTGDKIVAFMNGSNKSSNESFHGWAISGFLLDEIDRLHPNVIAEVKQRIQAKPNAHIIATMNPNDPNHPIYEELHFYESRNDVYYEHFTLADNAALTTEAREKIMNRYDPESVFFKRYVLGQRVVAENLIYNIRDWNIIDDYKINDYIGYVIIADPGINTSATVFVLAAITKGYEELHILKEYWHRNFNNKNLGIKMPIDYANDMTVFIRDSISLMNGRYPDLVMTDLDITFQRELRKALDKNKMANINFKDAIKDHIEDRISMGISLLWNKKLRFYKECTYTIQSFKTAQYDPNKASEGKFERYDSPMMGTMIDAVDATEYAMSFYAKRLYRR